MTPDELAARLIWLHREYLRLLAEFDAAYNGKGANEPEELPCSA